MYDMLYENRKNYVDLFNQNVWFFLERNLNPKAACLKRREEEKAEDSGPKLSHHLAVQHMVQPPSFPAMPPVKLLNVLRNKTITNHMFKYI